MKQNVTKISKLGWLFSGIAAFVSLLLPSCRIGLGEAVDTARPEISVDDSIVANTVYKDAFTLFGICKDDDIVDKVRVALTNNETGEGYLFVSDPEDETEEMEAELNLVRCDVPVEITRPRDAKGEIIKKYKREDRWSIKLNEKSDSGEFLVKDGKYTATVYALDRVNRKLKNISNAGRAIIVDNTAPVFLLASPTYNEDFGGTFKISGRVADDNAVEKMVVEFFKADAAEDAEPIATWEQTKIAPQIESNVAIWKKEGDLYHRIYGSNDLKHGFESLKCRITLIDEAGNSTSSFYMDKDSEVESFVTTQGISITDLYHIKNGSYKIPADRSVSETLYNDLKEWLFDSEKLHYEVPFRLNPEASPKYSLVGGYAAVKTYSEARKNEMLNGESILVQVDAGRDKNAINKDSIGIDLYVIEKDDYTEADDGIPLIEKVDPSSKITIFKPLIDKEGNATDITEEEKAIRAQSEFAKQETSYTITAKIDESIKLRTGITYLLVVTGFDSKKIDFDNLGAEYGFFLTAKGMAPTLTLTSPRENTIYLNREGEIEVSGQTSHEEGIPTVKVTVKKTEDEDIGTYSTTEPVVFTSLTDFEVKDRAFTLKLKPEDFIKEAAELDVSAQYDLTVVAEYGEFASNEITKAISYDVDDPEITNLNVIPVVDMSEVGGTEGNINGTVKISGSFNDAFAGVNTASLYYELNGDPETKTPITRQQNWEISLDTLTLSDNSPLVMNFYYEDKAGNKVNQPVEYKPGQKYLVNQESDKPIILPNGLEELPEGVKPGNGKNVPSQGELLTGTISDDDGLGRIEISCTTESGNKTGEFSKIISGDELKDAGGKIKKTYELKQNLPTVNGTYTLTIKVKDINDEPKEKVWSSLIKIMGRAPEIGDINAENPNVTSTGNGVKTFTITSSISGEHDPSTTGNSLVIKVSDENKTDDSDWTEIAWDASANDYESGETVEWSYTIDNSLIKPEEGSYTLYFKAFDSDGKSSSVKSLTYTVDNTLPVMKAFDVPEYISNPSVHIEAASELPEDTYFYQILPSTEARPAYSYSDIEAPASKWIEGTASGFVQKFAVEPTAAELKDGVLPEGFYKLYAVAMDSAKNTSVVLTEKEFVADLSVPVISDVAVTETLKEINSEEKAALSTNPAVVSAKITETVSGFDYISLYKGADKIGDFTLVDAEAQTYKYEITSAANLTDGDNKFTIKVMNNAGREVSAAVPVIVLDENLPVYKSISVSPKTGDFVNGKVTVTVSLSDNKKLAGPLTWNFGADLSGTVPVKAASSDTVSFEVDTNSLPDGNNTLNLSVKDAAGNTANDNDFVLKVDQETDKPKFNVKNSIVENKDKDSITTADDHNLLTRTGKLEVEVTDDDGLESIILEFRKAGTEDAFVPTTTLKGFTEEDKGVRKVTVSSVVPSDVEEGVYDIRITATDIKHDSVAYSSNTWETCLAVTDGAPSITIDESKENKPVSFVSNGAKNVVIKGSVTGGKTTKYKKTVKVGSNPAVAEFFTPTKDADGKLKFEHTISEAGVANDNTTVTVTYEATNDFGQSADPKSWTYVIDNKKPVLSSISVASETYDAEKWRKENTVNFTGSWTEDGSGISEIYYWVTNSTADPGAAEKSGTMSAILNGTSLYDFNDTVYNFANGQQYVHFKAIDNVNNVSNDIYYKINVDNKAPVLTLNKEAIKITDGKLIVSKKDLESAAGIQISGTLSEDISYINTTKAVTVYEGADTTGNVLAQKAYLGSSATDKVNGTKTFSGLKLDYSKLTKEAGKYKDKYIVTVVGLDALENSSAESFELTVDEENPTVTIDSPKDRTGKNSIVDQENPITLKGKATDNVAVSSVYYQISAGKVMVAPSKTGSGWTKVDAANGQWEVKLSSRQDYGTYTAFVYAEDKSGNTSDIISSFYDIDNAGPVITLKLKKGTGSETVIQNTSGNEEVVSEDSFDIIVNVKDEYKLNTYTVTVDGATAGGWTQVTANKEYKNTIHKTEDKVYEIAVEAVDAVGKVTRATRKIRLDHTGPNIKFTSPDLTKWQKEASFNVKGIVSDPTSGVEAVYWTTDDSAPNSSAEDLKNEKWTKLKSTSNWEVALSNLTEGENGKLYIAAVDKAGNLSVEHKDLKVDRTAPTLGLYATPEDAASEDAAEISGTKSSNDSVTFYIKASDKTPGSGLASVKVGSKEATPVSDSIYSYTVSKVADSTVKETCSVEVTDNAGHKASKTLYVVVDSKAPVVSEVSPSKKAGEYINGTINFTFNVQDETALGGTYSYKVTDTEVQGTGTFIAGTVYENITIENFDTTSITSGRNDNVEFVVTVQDAVGNETEKTTVLKVDQATDKPKFEATNAKGNDYADNVFGLGNWSVGGKVTDDDGLGDVKVKFVPQSGATVIADDTYKTYTSVLGDTSKGKAMANVVIPVNQNYNGKYKLYVQVFDNNTPAVESEEYEINLAVDNSAPEISVVSVNGKDYSTAMFVPDSFNVVLTASDSNGVKDVRLKDAPSALSLVDGTYTHSVSDRSSGDNQKLVYVVTDNYNRKAEKEIIFSVDTEDPVVNPDAFKVTGGKKTVAFADNIAKNWFSSASIAVSAEKSGETVPVTDVNLSENATYKLTGATEAESSFEISRNSAASTVEGTMNNNRSVNNGTTHFLYTFYDKAGNSATFETDVFVDNVAPVLGDYAIKVGDTTLTSSSIINAENITVEISGTDATSGITDVLIGKSSGFKDTEKVNDAVTITTTPATATSPLYGEPDLTGAKKVTLTVQTSKLSEGRNELFVRLVDAAGNASIDQSIGTFTLDKIAPVVEIKTPIDGATVNGTITLSGTVSDSNIGPETKPVLYIDGEEIKSGVTLTRKSTGEWEVSGINTRARDLTDEDSHTFTVTFEDMAGNVTAESGSGLKNQISLNVSQDTDRPEIKLTNLSNGKTINTTEISGSITDDDGIIPEGKRNLFKVAVITSKGSLNDSSWKNPKDFDGTAWTVDVKDYFEGVQSLDNEYKVFFQLQDADGKDFSVKATDSLDQPKLKDENDAAISLASDGSVSFAIDKEKPVIENIWISFDGKPHTEDKAWEKFDGGKFYGGTEYPSAMIKIEARDKIVTDPENLTVTVEIQQSEDSEGNAVDTIELKGSDIKYHESYHYATLDFKSYNDGLLLIYVKAADDSGDPGVERRNVNIDNTPPNEVHKSVRPDSSTEATAAVTMTGTVFDDGEGVAKMEYCIPTRKLKTDDAPVLPTNAASDSGFTWIAEGDDNPSKLTRNSNSWTIAFTDLATDSSTINENYGGYTSDDIIYNIPVWFRITDTVGNIRWDATTLRYNPDADRPRVEITYPKADKSKEVGSGVKNYVVIGGNIEFNGIATDNDGIDAVYVQYDVDGDGDYDETDYNWLNTNKAAVLPDPSLLGNYTVNGVSFWAVKATGKASWNTEFNTAVLSKELSDANKSLEVDNENNGGTYKEKTLNVRVRAADTDDFENKRLVSAWTELHVSLNDSKPQFSKFNLVQYPDDSHTTPDDVLQVREYVAGMYLNNKGYWRLEGSVRDQQNIYSIKLRDGIKANYVDSAVITSDGTGKVTAIDEAPKGYNIMVPITETLKLTIEATDNTTDREYNTRTFNINVDGTAPEFMEGDDADALVLHRDTSGGSKLSEKEISNSDGLVSIFSKAKDNGSGFDKAVFYVVRRGDGETTNDRIYNVMKPYGADRMQNRFAFTENDDVGETEPTYTSKATPNVFINEDGLPVVKAAITSRADNATLTVQATDIAKDSNIFEFGYLYIGGSYHLIKGITNSGDDEITVVFDGAADKEKFSESVYFVYGTMAVDHTGESLNEDGTISDDDGVSVGLSGKGDRMLESMVTLGTETTWSASFDSNNIPDGPLEVHVVVFDKAGNARHGKVDTKVSNNRPRIARVTLGTDLDGSGSIEKAETTLFYAYPDKPELTKTVNGQTVENYAAGIENWILDAKKENGGLYWKIKEGLSITPEFVGGTGNIHYYYTAAAGVSNLSSAQGSSVTRAKTGTLSRNASGKIAGTITLENSDLLSSDDDKINTYRFSFWDETEETTPGKDSGWCILNAQLYQDINDGLRPQAFIHPFFWHKKGGNATDSNVSAYNSIQWDADGTALGHIELEADIIDSIKNASSGKTTGTTTLGNDDPKVSGKIVIRGSAYDETKLVSVTVKSSNDTSVLGGESGITASRKTKTVSGKTVYTNEWNVGEVDGKDCKLTVEETVGIGQKGHLVSWTLEVDTEAVAGIVKPDVYFNVTANDGSGDSTAATTGQAAYNATVYYSTEEQAEAGKFYTSKETKDSDLVEVLDIKDWPTKFGETEKPGVYEYKIAKANDKTTNFYKVDVVPYVSEVVTHLSGYDGSIAGKYSRSSLGHYPVQSTQADTYLPNATNKNKETITLKGFNLAGTDADVVVKTGDTPITADVTKTAKTATELSKLAFSASTTLKTDALSVTVNGVPLMNNINKTAAMGTASSVGDGNENCYNMQPNKDNNNNLTDDIYFDVWDINDRVAKATGSNKMYGLNMDIGYNQSLIRYAYVTSDKYQFMGTIGKDNNFSAKGKLHDKDYLSPYSISFHVLKDGSNTYSTYHGGEEDAKYRIVKNGTDGNYIKNVPGYSQGMKDVVHSPVFASGSSSYFAYYDKIDKQIKFYTIGQINAKNTPDYQTLASSSMTGRNIGPYVSLAVAKNGDNDVVCAVWYDLPNGKLLYSYKEDPTSNPTAANAGGWSKAKPVFGDEKGGEYAQIKVDDNGGIHVAGKFGGKLMYAYKARYNTNDLADNGGFTTCTVDVNDAGNNLTMDVALSGEKPVVTLGYLSSNTPKYAKINDGRLCSDAVDSENLYVADKVWDISFVPVRNKISLASHEKVNVGLWKTTAGALANSTRTASSYTAGGTSTLYGNGTNNGVLLYLTDGGENMESAQRR